MFPNLVTKSNGTFSYKVIVGQNFEHGETSGFPIINNEAYNNQQEGQGQQNHFGFQGAEQMNYGEAPQEIAQHKMEEDAATSDTSDEDLRKEMDLMMGSDDEDHEKGGETKFKTKNEVNVKDAVPDVEEILEERYKRLNIDVAQVNNLHPIGRIEFIIDDKVVILSQAENVLDLDCLLFTQNKIPLGAIDDVFGQVNIPHYTVFNDKFLKKRILDKEINKGDTVYFDTVFSKILPQSQIEALKRKKGCDASNRFDEESIQPEEVEFSDDEREEEFSRNKRAPKNAHNKEKKRQQKNQARHQRNEQNIVYNQGMPQASYQNHNMYAPQQQMYPMNQYQPMQQMQPMNQYQMGMGMQGMQGMPGQMQMQMPMQNMPLFFNPMMGQNMNQQPQMPMQGYQGYQPQQQMFMPNNNMFSHQPHNM